MQAFVLKRNNNYFIISIIAMLTVTIFLVSCNKDDDLRAINANEIDISAQTRSSDAGTRLFNSWWTWNQIQYDFNTIDSFAFYVNYGHLDINRVFRVRSSSSSIEHHVIPIESEEGGIFSAAITKSGSNKDTFYLVNYTSDMTILFENIQEADSGGTIIAGFHVPIILHNPPLLDDGEAGNQIGGLKFKDWFEGTSGSCLSPELFCFAPCPNGKPLFQCGHCRDCASWGGEGQGSSGNPDQGGGGSQDNVVVVDIESGSSGVNIILGGSTGTGSLKLVFTRQQLEETLNYFNGIHNTNLAYHRFLDNAAGCLYLANGAMSDPEELLDVVGICFEMAFFEENYADCSNEIEVFLNSSDLDEEIIPRRLALILGDDPTCDCSSQSLFNDCSNERLASWLVEELSLINEELEWLLLNTSSLHELARLHLKYESEEANAFFVGFLRLKIEDNDVKWKRAEDLYHLLSSEENALIQECLDEDPSINIQDYQALFNFEMPIECEARLMALGQGWEPQPIGEGNTKLASLDYYPVRITQRPDFNNDGIPDSNPEIYNSIRANFLTLASGMKEQFDPVCGFPAVTSDVAWEFMYYDEVDQNYIGNDRSLWASSDPLTSIFYIDASSSNFFLDHAADHGAVIVSNYCTDECWTFSTITTPASSSQPLSGNRQWGLVDDGNGDLIFYNRACDRAFIDNKISIFSSITCATEDYYRIGVHTWENLRDNIANFISENGGQAYSEQGKAINPAYSVLYEALKSNVKIESIPCINH